MVGVAQLVERQVVVLDVAGSSPVAHPTYFRRSEAPVVVMAGAIVFQCPILGARWERIFVPDAQLV
jgi:hypothetical protein